MSLRVALARTAEEAAAVDTEAIHVTGGWCQRCGWRILSPEEGSVFILDPVLYRHSCSFCGAVLTLDWRS